MPSDTVAKSSRAKAGQAKATDHRTRTGAVRRKQTRPGRRAQGGSHWVASPGLISSAGPAAPFPSDNSFLASG